MKKFLLFMLFLVLTGCVPEFVSHTQEISLEKFYAQNPNAKVYYEGEEQTDKVELFRSWFDKELVIKKEGFEDYHVKLESEWKNELAFIPYGTAGTLGVGLYGCFGWGHLPSCLLILATPIGAAADVVTGIVTVPASVLVNPWKHYDETALQSGAIVLEPTEELKKNCKKEGYFISNLGCTKCSYEGDVVASLEETLKCTNRFQNRNRKNISSFCPKGNFVSEDGRSDKIAFIGGCRKCSDKTPYLASDASCRSCSNRHSKNGICMIKCPKEKPLQDELGYCHSCNEKSEIRTDECEKCTNRYISNWSCVLKCPENEPMRDGRGKCYPCDAKDPIETDECAKCSNRQMYGKYCALSECPADKLLKDNTDGKCYPCDINNSVSTNGCDKCPNRKHDNLCLCGKRRGNSMYNPVPCDISAELIECKDMCFLKECPSDAPIRVSDGSCYSCEALVGLDATLEECSKCPNRYFSGTRCWPYKCNETDNGLKCEN